MMRLKSVIFGVLFSAGLGQQFQDLENIVQETTDPFGLIDFGALNQLVQQTTVRNFGL